MKDLGVIGLYSTLKSFKSWIHHLQGQYKLNCDGARNPLLGNVGMGIICRDDHGNCLEVTFLSLPEVDVLTAKPMTIREGLRIARTRRRGNAIVETDSKIAFWCVSSGQSSSWKIRGLIKDITELAKSFFFF